MRAVIYSRYSSNKQDTSFSIEEQNDANSKLATQEGYEIVKIFEDKAQSAKTINRPALLAMLKFVCNSKNNISVIYCYDISRISRNQLDFLVIKKQLSEHGISLRSIQGVSGDSLEGSLIQDIMSRVSQFKNEIDSVKIKGGMYNRFKQGYALRKVRGYKWGKNEAGRSILVPDDTFVIFQSLWLKIASEKLTLPNALEHINRLLPKSKLTKSTLSRLLQNKIYYGVLSYPTYAEEVKGVHEPMIAEEVYWQVREIIEGRKQQQTNIRHKTNPLYPLTKLLLCHKCGKRLTAAGSIGKNKNNVFSYYFCRDRKSCKVNLSVKRVHESFVELLKSIQITSEMAQYLKEFIQEKYETYYNDLGISSKTVEKDVTVLEAKFDSLLNIYTEGTITKEEYLSFKEKLMPEYLSQKALLSDKKLERIDIEIVLNFVTYYLQNISTMWEHASIEAKIAIQCSAFPQGVYFEKDSCRTPEIGFAFAFSKQIISLCEPTGIRTRNQKLKRLLLYR